MYIDLSQALLFILIMLRFTGFLVFNPILGRRNIPTIANAGIALLLAILLVGSASPPAVTEPSVPQLALMVFREMFIGFVASIVFQMFLALFALGGELIDMQMGLAMAKAFDPGTNASISLTSNFFNAMFILIFFTTGNHLTFIRMIALSFQVLPAGQIALNLDGFYYLPEFFSTVLVFAVKLALPVVLIEIIVTFSVGIIMRIIPQINVFVVSIQFKLFTGLLLLVILVGPFLNYFGNMIQISFETLFDLMGVMFKTES